MSQGNKTPKVRPPVIRDDHGRVISGCPNPSGVSKERALCKRMFEERSEIYRARLEELGAQSDNLPVALEATKTALAYALGKPNLIITGEDGGPVKIDADLLGSLQRLAARVG